MNACAREPTTYSDVSVIRLHLEPEGQGRPLNLNPGASKKFSLRRKNETVSRSFAEAVVVPNQLIHSRSKSLSHVRRIFRNCFRYQ